MKELELKPSRADMIKKAMQNNNDAEKNTGVFGNLLTQREIEGALYKHSVDIPDIKTNVSYLHLLEKEESEEMVKKGIID